jgi:hypothetical protein
MNATALVVGHLGNGTFTQSGGTANVNGTLTVASQPGSVGTYNLQGGLLKATTITPGSGTAAFNFTGGTLSVGTYNGDLTQTGGTLSPGNSPGITHITGDWNMGASSFASINYQAPGITAGVDFDQIIVDGIADLNGTFNLFSLDESVPTVGFNFLTASSINNNATFNLPESWSAFTINLVPEDEGFALQLDIGSPVPEPATIVSMLSGLLMLTFRRVFRLGEGRFDRASMRRTGKKGKK